MNVGKFHFIVKKVKEEIEEKKLLSLLEQLRNNLQQSILQPNENTSNQFRNSLQELKDETEKCCSNFFTQSEFGILEEIGGATKTGNGLFSVIYEIISSNNMFTPVEALNKLQKVHEEVISFYSNLSKIYEAFTELAIEFDELKEDEFEIGYLIPKELTDQTLKGLSKEFKNIETVIITVKEILGENASRPIIRKLSNSDFQVFLNSTPAVILFIVTIIERIVALTKQVYEIRKIHKDMLAQNLPDNLTKTIVEHIEQTISLEMSKIAESLVQENYIREDEARKNELINLMKKNLEYLSDRIDKGAVLEVKTEEPVEPKVTEQENEESVEFKRKLEEYQRRQEISNKIKNFKLLVKQVKDDKNILYLSESAVSREE
jgi:hypothetical protein